MDGAAVVTVIVEGVRRGDTGAALGQVACAIFASEEGFPSEQDLARHGQISPAKAGAMTFVFADVVAGDYAVTILHDENSNGRLDTNFLGMPREGYGVSNNAYRRFGPPRFDAACVHLEPGTTIRLTVQYP